MEVLDVLGNEEVQWAYNEHNPDYRLVVVHAANDGFQSKMDIEKGSYTITQFCKRLQSAG